MLRYGCGMMIECEIKTGQTVESIEHTRRKKCEGVGLKLNERGDLIDEKGDVHH